MPENFPSSDLGIFIGRFQPFHLGHQFIVEEALKRFSKLLLIVGSSNAPYSLKNPFTFEDRVQLIHQNLDFFLPDSARQNVHLIGLEDYPEDPIWINAFYERVKPFLPDDQKGTLVGYDKDASTYYLDLLKQSAPLELCLLENYRGINATTIRNVLFENPSPKGLESIREMISPVTEQFLNEFQKKVKISSKNPNKGEAT